MNAITENEIKLQGVNALISALGEVRAEHFISLISKERFDYTKWHKTLFLNNDIADISNGAMFEEKRFTADNLVE